MDTPDLRSAIERYHAECFGWALSCCGRDRVEAEDVLQTSYLKVLQGRARFDDRSSVKTWLFGVIRNTASEERRRVFTRRRIGEAQAAEAVHVTVQPGVTAAEDAQRNAQLVIALASLAPRQREVLQLVFYHDMTIEDAAVVMGVSLGTARTHYERGKSRLRVLLGVEPS